MSNITNITAEFMAAVSKGKTKAYVYSKADDILSKAAGSTFDEVVIFSDINELNAENAVVILPSEKFNDIMTFVKDSVIITYGCRTGKKSSYTDVFEKNGISWYNLFGFPHQLLVSSLTKAVIAGEQENVYEIRPLKGTSLSITDKNGNGAPAGAEGIITQSAGDETFRTFFKGVILASGKTYFTGFEDNYFYADGKYYDTSKVIESLSADADVNDCAGVNEDIYIVSGNGKDAQYFLDRIHELGIPVNCNLIDRIPRENGTVIKDELEKILKNSNVSKAVSINEELYNGICEVWKSVLNTESVEPYEDFFESGGNSILVSKLMFEMLKKFSITIPFHYILENSNVMGLYNFIVNNGKVSEEQEQAKLEKLRKEMESCLDLDFSVKERIAQCSGKGDTKNLLLTGATGFLGIFILKFCKYDFEFRVNEVAFLKDGGVKDTIDKVLEIWKDTLKINDIDINANIFDIGGNSITIYLLADKMTKELGETINAVDIMTYPNVKEFASFLYLRRSGSSKEEVNAEGSERAEKIKNARRRSKTGRRA